MQTSAEADEDTVQIAARQPETNAAVEPMTAQAVFDPLESEPQTAAQADAAGALDLAALETLPDARLLEALMQQHGVGIKVANCVALFAYGRMECAPVDVWIQRVIDQHYAGQNPFPAYGNAGILQQWMFYFARSEKERVK